MNVRTAITIQLMIVVELHKSLGALNVGHKLEVVVTACTAATGRALHTDS